MGEFLNKPVSPMVAGLACLLLALLTSALIVWQLRNGFSQLLLRDEARARANGLPAGPRGIYVNAIIALVAATLIALVWFVCGVIFLVVPLRG